MISMSFLPSVGLHAHSSSVTDKLVGSNLSTLGRFDQPNMADENIKLIADELLKSNDGDMHTAIESGLSLFGKAQELYVNSKDSRLLRYLAEIELAKQSGKTEIFLGDTNGIGIWSRTDNQVFFGTFKDGELVTGEHLDQYGNHYVGQFKGGRYHGTGVMTWHDNAKYTGQFNNGLPEGKGRIEHANKEIYEGDFKGGVKNGKGKQTSTNGDVYTGEFANDKANGKGIFQPSTKGAAPLKQDYANGHLVKSEEVVNGQDCCVVS